MNKEQNHVKDTTENLHIVFNKVIQNDFKSFLNKSFQTLHPSKEFIDNWHYDLLYEYFKAIEKNQIKRLIVNLPPRSLKSILISVAWPCWILGHKPTAKIIVASYSKALSIKHSLDSKAIIESSWYTDAFPNTIIKKGCNTQQKFITTKRGFRFATSVGSTLTGEGGDFLIADDPMTPNQALSPKQRIKIINWFEQTFVSRLNDKKKGVIIIVMQRLHKDDLSGYLLNHSDWHHISIPAISEKSQIFKYAEFNKNMLENEILNSKQDSFDDIQKIKKEIGEYTFSSQYQQAPTNINGTMVKRAWIKKYKELPNITQIYQSWDTAIKINHNSDYSVCSTWGIYENHFYLMNVLRCKLEYPELKTAIINQFNLFRPNGVLLEDKASGQQIIQELQGSDIPIISQIHSQNKITRLIGSLCLFESGKIFFPEDAEWITDLEEELFSFPNCSHDDQVDSISQFILWFQSRMELVPNIRFF